MTPTDALALLASGVFLVRLLPQPVRLARQGVAAGVSSLAALNAVVAALAWVAYGRAADLLVVWAVSAMALGPGLWQVWLLRRSTTRRDLASAGMLVGALALAAALGVLGVALAGLVVVTVGPQVRRAVTSDDVSGISPATWWVATVDAVTWGLYGVAVGDPALVGYFLVLSVAAGVVLWRLSGRAIMAS